MWPWHVRRWVSRWRSSAVEMRPRWWVVRAWRWIVRAWRRLVRRWPAVGVRLVAGRHGWVPHQVETERTKQPKPVWTYLGERQPPRLGNLGFILFHNPSQKNKRFTFSFTHTAPTRYFLLVVRRAPPTSTQSQRNAQTPRTPHARTRPQHCRRRTVGAGAHQLLTNPCVLTASCSIRLGSVPATVPAATAAVPAASSTSATQHAAASRHGAGLLLGSSGAPQAAA